MHGLFDFHSRTDETTEPFAGCWCSVSPYSAAATARRNPRQARRRPGRSFRSWSPQRNGLPSARGFNLLTASIQQAQAAVHAAKASITQAELNVEYSTITSAMISDLVTISRPAPQGHRRKRITFNVHPRYDGAFNIKTRARPD